MATTAPRHPGGEHGGTDKGTSHDEEEPWTVQFAVDTNVHWFDSSRAAKERLSIKSRWIESGEGRSDVRLNGGDLSSSETLNECWDNRFRSTFLDRTDSLEGWGSESQDCAFKSAEYTN